MAKRGTLGKARPISTLVNITVWITGILVSLAVGFGMIQGTLTIPLLSDIAEGLIVVWAGWIVVILTILSIILAIVDRL